QAFEGERQDSDFCIAKPRSEATGPKELSNKRRNAVTSPERPSSAGQRSMCRRVGGNRRERLASHRAQKGRWPAWITRSGEYARLARNVVATSDWPATRVRATYPRKHNSMRLHATDRPTAPSAAH